MTRTELAALVGSRICHDLISPIGAIGNGLELLSLTNGNTTAEMALISDSLDNANARIRYFRIAFGTASADQLIGRAEILKILSANAQGGRFTYLWQVGGDQQRAMVRCAFLMLQCLETALPLGGEIQIDQDRGGWVFKASGSRIAANPALWATLTDQQTGYQHTPAQVQFALLPDLLAQTDHMLTVDIAHDRIIARF